MFWGAIDWTLCAIAFFGSIFSGVIILIVIGLGLHALWRKLNKRFRF